MVIVGKSISGSFDDLAICAGAAAFKARQGRKNVDSHRREANLKMVDFFRLKTQAKKDKTKAMIAKIRSFGTYLIRTYSMKKM